MALRNPLTEGERSQAAYVWETLLRYDRTADDLALGLAAPKRTIRRELAALTDHNLLQWYSDGTRFYGGRDRIEDRHYAARVDPHAIRGYRTLFGREMPGTVLLVTRQGERSQLALVRTPFGAPPFTWGRFEHAERFPTIDAAVEAARAAGVETDATIIRRHVRELTRPGRRPHMTTITNTAL